jgi:hypothetical protein
MVCTADGLLMFACHTAHSLPGTFVLLHLFSKLWLFTLLVGLIIDQYALLRSAALHRYAADPPEWGDADDGLCQPAP